MKSILALLIAALLAPLASGIAAATDLADRLRRQGESPLLVLMTDGRANDIYDAYERAGGGKDVSGSQFVKNSQFGIGPFSGMAAAAAKDNMNRTDNVDVGDDMDADTSMNQPKFMRGKTPK